MEENTLEHSREDAYEKLADLIRNANTETSRYEAALATLAFLKVRSGLDIGIIGGIDALEVAELVALHLLPIHGEPSGTETRALTAETALASLDMLLGELSQTDSSLSDAALLSIITYTNGLDQWSTESAASTARHLLHLQLPGDKLNQFIVGPLLRDYFRPLFSRSSTRVTSSGRPSYYKESEGTASSTPQRPSWKDGTGGPIVISRFRWVIEASEENLLASNWPLFTPPLLTLIEDDQTVIRKDGLEIMNTFLRKCPLHVLEASGMRSVIEDAVFPTLLFLPSLTPEAESVDLLHVAYQALLLLARQGHPRSTQKSLDKLFRDGIVAAYSHASEYSRIVELLMKYTTAIVRELGLSATKHLPTLLPIFTSILQDPFALLHLPLVLATVEALNATLANCWPRMSSPAHTEQVVNIIAICWLNLHDTKVTSQEPSGDMQQLEEQLKLAAACLEASWSQLNFSPPQSMATVIQREPLIADLFPVFSRRSIKSA